MFSNPQSAIRNPQYYSVPAKINLWLEVVRKRADGYHELSSLMLPIEVFDHLELVLGREEGISMECADPDVPTDGSNLAWRAAEAYLGASAERAGVRIRLTKNIPAAAGLGGGSADAAAMLLMLNRAFANRLSMAQLHDLALQLGADVPFFLYQCPALATGVGEKLHRVKGIPDYPLVLIKPPITVSTRWVFQSLKLTRGVSNITLGRLLAQPWRLREVMQNDLESVTLNAYPLLGEIKEWLLEEGAVGALMSGSGPTMFGVFEDGIQAERVQKLAMTKWQECWVANTRVRNVSAAGQDGISGVWGVAKR